ncbi:MAG: alpha/beta fold hydrolase [Myxococcales bacterium]|nr:alpha/beta fold hydrolase [Myxococcales bacterium]
MPARATLHHELLIPAGATRLVAFTHGLYGSGSNWRSIARQVLARAPGWGAALIDLRLHGRSSAGAPPHTVAACTGDVAALIAELGAAGPPVAVAVGHSFGGKVVLGLDALAHRVILDSTPSARPGAWAAPDNSVRDAWTSMRALDQVWPRRDDYVAALVARGHAPALAGWLAMNLAPVDGGLRLRLDLDAVRALVLDYYAVDVWPSIEAATGPITMVVAERGGTVSADDLARLEHAPAIVTTHVVAGAGHWLHLDAPAAVVDHVVAALPAP